MPVYRPTTDYVAQLWDDRLLWGVTLNGLHIQPPSGAGNYRKIRMGAHDFNLTNEVAPPLDGGPDQELPVQALELIDRALSMTGIFGSDRERNANHLIICPGVPDLPAGTAADQAKGKNWRNYAVLAGPRQSYGTMPLNGWLVPEAVGQVYHIGQFFHSTTITDRNAPYTITLQVRRFGVMHQATPDTPVTITATCADLQQRYVGDPRIDGTDNSLRIYLYSIKPDGREAILALHLGSASSGFPTGFLKLTLTGDGPNYTAALTVYKNRQDTAGSVNVTLPLTAALSTVAYATQTFDDSEKVAPDDPLDLRYYVRATLSAPVGPQPGGGPFIDRQDYQAEVVGRTLSVNYRRDGSICETTVDYRHEGWKTVTFSDFAAEGEVEGIWPSGTTQFTTLLEPIVITATATSTAEVNATVEVFVGGVRTDLIELSSDITRSRPVQGTPPTLPFGDVRPDTRSFFAGVGLNSGTGTASAEWNASIIVNGTTVATHNRVDSDVGTSNPASTMSITYTRTWLSFAYTEIFNKNDGNHFSTNLRAWHIAAVSSNNWCQTYRWGNANTTGSVLGSSAYFAVNAPGDRLVPADITTLRPGSGYGLNNAYDPYAEELHYIDDNHSLLYL